MEKKRIFLFDNMKFFLIMTVVIGHFIDQQIKYPAYKSLFLFIYAFHMPLFIFISGIFHKNKKILEKALVYILLGYLLKLFIFYTRRGLGETPKLQFLSDSGAAWFMFAMAAFMFISYYLRDIDKRFVLILSIFLGCIVNYDTSIGDYLYLSRIVVFFPFYHLGTMLDVDTVYTITERKRNKVIGTVILLIWAFVCVFLLENVYDLRFVFTGRNSFSKEWYVYGAFVRLVCYTVTAVVSFSLLCVMPNREIPGWTRFGARTMQVYFWHRPIVYVLTSFGVPVMMCKTTISKMFYIIIAVVLTYLLSSKVFAFPTEPILKMRDKLNVRSN